MKKLYFIKEVTEPEMIECPTCKGTGKIVGTVISDALEKPIENHELSCPTCGGAKEISSGKTLHYKIGVLVEFGDARVEDNGEKGEYFLGFVCDDDSMIEKFKEQNNISDFVTYPNALSFYMKREDTKMYDTYEEAQAVCNEKEKNWKPSSEEN